MTRPWKTCAVARLPDSFIPTSQLIQVALGPAGPGEWIYTETDMTTVPTIQFRKKPVVIEARQFLGPFSIDEMVEDWGEAFAKVHSFGNGVLRIYIDEGFLYPAVGDWVIKGVAGEFYSCKDDVFAATYEPASAPTELASLISQERRSVASCVLHMTKRQETQACTSLREALAALEQAAPLAAPRPEANASQAVPEGWKLVPADPTREMMESAPSLPAINVVADRPLRDAGWSMSAIQNRTRYLAMISAAPHAPCSDRRVGRD